MGIEKQSKLTSHIDELSFIQYTRNQP